MKQFLLNIYQRIYLYLYRDVIALSDTRRALWAHKQSQDALTKAIASMESTITNQQTVLLDLAANVKFLAQAKRQEHARAGHKVVAQ